MQRRNSSSFFKRTGAIALALVAAALLTPVFDAQGQGRADDAFGEIDKHTRKQEPADAKAEPVQAKPGEGAATPADAQPEAKPLPPKPFQLAGTAEAYRHVEIRADMEAYDGELRLVFIQRSGSMVEEGQQIAQLEPVDLHDKLRRAEDNLERARLAMEMTEIDANGLEERQELARRDAEFALQDARAAFENWIKYDKEESIRNVRMAVTGQEHSIEDQEDELRQLKELYQTNDLAKESQDIVIKRSERSLERSRERLKTLVANEKQWLEGGLERRHRDLELAVDNAERKLERMPMQHEREELSMEFKLSEARSSLIAWEEQVEKMHHDVAERMNISAPAAGLFVHGALKGNDGISNAFNSNDKIKRSELLGTIISTETLEVITDIPVHLLSRYPEGMVLQAHVPGSDQIVRARIAGVGALASKGAVKARIIVNNQSKTVIPGSHLEFHPAEPLDRRRDGEGNRGRERR